MFSHTRRKILKECYRKGIVQFVVDPNLEHGTVCKIGDNWFYFGGMTAEEEDPEEFMRNADIEEVLDAVNRVIDAMYMFEETCDEAAYYDAFLNENAPRYVVRIDYMVDGFTNSKYVTDDSNIPTEFLAAEGALQAALEKADHKIVNIMIRKPIGKCKKCGCRLYESDIEQYSTQCFNCDEDFY